MNVRGGTATKCKTRQEREEREVRITYMRGWWDQCVKQTFSNTQKKRDQKEQIRED